MCLQPRRIYNPTSKLGFSNNQRYEIDIPCGECAECKKLKKDEWYLRTYWHAKETWDEGGYILFDTLTYNNENLPHISDFIDFSTTEFEFKHEYDEKGEISNTIIDVKKVNLKDQNRALYEDLNCSCFKTEDYRLFFVRLRRALDYRNYDSTKLTYFLTSEYGSTEGFTHRPHYHVLFFVKDRNLDPITLSNMINRCWKKGRTDGVGYYHKGFSDSKDYVLKKRVFGRGYNEDEQHMRAVCNYVAKYVMKDSEFQRVIDERLTKLCKYLYKEEDFIKREELYKKLSHEVSQFHRQSKGYGEYALNFLDDNLKETGMMYIPDHKSPSGKKHIMMPMYYLMKLYYYPYVDSKGKKKMILTEEGINWKIDRCKKSVVRLADRYKDWFNNIGLNYGFNKDFPYSQEYFQKLIFDLMDGRSWRDLAEYSMVYKGRIMPEWVRNSKKKDDFECMLNDIFVPCTDECFDEDYDIVLYNYATKTTRKVWRCNFLCYRSIGEFEGDVNNKKWTGNPLLLDVGYDSLSEVYKGSLKDRLGANMITPMWFKRNYCYNQYTIDEFRNFDDVLDWMSRFNEGINSAKQRAFDKKEEVSKRLKDARNAGIL